MTTPKSGRSRPIQILLDSGSRAHHNVGDVALLIACHAYLRDLWPEAGFSVLSEER